MKKITKIFFCGLVLIMFFGFSFMFALSADASSEYYKTKYYSNYKDYTYYDYSYYDYEYYDYIDYVYYYLSDLYNAFLYRFPILSFLFNRFF